MSRCKSRCSSGTIIGILRCYMVPSPAAHACALACLLARSGTAQVTYRSTTHHPRPSVHKRPDTAMREPRNNCSCMSSTQQRVCTALRQACDIISSGLFPCHGIRAPPADPHRPGNRPNLDHTRRRGLHPCHRGLVHTRRRGLLSCRQPCDRATRQQCSLVSPTKHVNHPLGGVYVHMVYTIDTCRTMSLYTPPHSMLQAWRIDC